MADKKKDTRLDDKKDPPPPPKIEVRAGENTNQRPRESRYSWSYRVTRKYK